jgi:two-component system response regulator AtoC
LSRILIVDDDKALCRSLQIQLQLHNHEASSAYDVSSGLELSRKIIPELILLDINLPDQDGLSALPLFLELYPETPIVIMTAESGSQLVVDAMRIGAVNYLRKPFDLKEVLQILETFTRNKEASRIQLSDEDKPLAEEIPPEMIGSHPTMINILKNIGLLSRSRVTVLIQGESGTGKELAARILHEATAPGQPFVAVNCSAVVPTLLESEFFGHEKGAFTGADKTKIGKLQHAGEGTVFLDEIGDMPLNLQSKLLRVLQEEEFVRVGGLKSIQFKARIIAATHCDLEQIISTGDFRQDLYYRLAVSSIHLPPLRERCEDIPLLVEFLFNKIRRKLQCNISSISEEAMMLLRSYDWPGNVRELENVLTRASAIGKSSILHKEDIEFTPSSVGRKATLNDLPVALVDAERQHIARILDQNNWNISHSATMLEISRTTLRKKIADFHLKEAR